MGEISELAMETGKKQFSNDSQLDELQQINCQRTQIKNDINRHFLNFLLKKQSKN